MSGGTKPGPITELWAYTCMNPDGREGVVAFISPLVGSTPMVVADEDLARKLAPKAREIAKQTGLPITLKRFQATMHVEVISP